MVRSIGCCSRGWAGRRSSKASSSVRNRGDSRCGPGYSTREAEGKFTAMQRSSERGSGRVQFFIVMTVFVVTAYAGYLYVPVAYRAREYADLMQHYADLSGAQERPVAW